MEAARARIAVATRLDFAILKPSMDRIYLFFAANYFAQGMSGIAYEPIDYLLKDRLGLSAGQASMFVFWMTLPFLIKPVFGLVTDALPIAGRRRLPHIVAASAIGAAAWIVLAAQTRYTYGWLLLLLIATNVGIAFADVVCDAVMVERGKELSKTGPYQAAQIGTLYLSLVVTGLGGGWLSAHANYRQIFALTAAFPALILLSSIWIQEPTAPPPPRQALRSFGGVLLQRRFWALSLLIFLWNFYPFLGTVQFYYQSDVLKLSPVYIGAMSTLGGFAGVLGAAFFWKGHGRWWDADRAVRSGALAGALISLAYFAYLGPVSVAFVEALFGFSSVVLRLILMDLLARACPENAEGTTFALYMAMFNITASASNTVGGKVFDAMKAAHYSPQTSAYGLILIGSLCTLACWWLVPTAIRPSTRG